MDSHSKLNSSDGGKKVDKSKVRCFNFHGMGHYVTNFPSKNCPGTDPWKDRKVRHWPLSLRWNLPSSHAWCHR